MQYYIRFSTSQPIVIPHAVCSRTFKAAWCMSGDALKVHILYIEHKNGKMLMEFRNYARKLKMVW